MALSIVVGFVLFIAGAAMLIWAWVCFHRALLTMAWPSVPGAIVESGVTDGGGLAIPALRGRYVPIVRYTYRVDDSTRTGSRITRAPYRFSQKRAAEQVVSRYPAGTPVRVFHHPRDASRCVLEPGTSPENYRLFFLGTVLLALGAAALSLFPA